MAPIHVTLVDPTGHEIDTREFAMVPRVGESIHFSHGFTSAPHVDGVARYRVTDVAYDLRVGYDQQIVGAAVYVIPDEPGAKNTLRAIYASERKARP